MKACGLLLIGCQESDPFWGGDIWAEYWKARSIHVEFGRREYTGRGESIHWTRGGFKLIHHPSAFGLESVNRPVFPNKLRKLQVWFSVAEFEGATTFLFSLHLVRGIALGFLECGNALVNFSFLWEEGPWLSSDSHKGWDSLKDQNYWYRGCCCLDNLGGIYWDLDL